MEVDDQLTDAPEESASPRPVEFLRYLEVLIVIAALGFVARQAFWESPDLPDSLGDTHRGR